jgi:hypothetical protein
VNVTVGLDGITFLGEGRGVMLLDWNFYRECAGSVYYGLLLMAC